MGHKSYCKNRIHVTVIVLMLLPTINLLNADSHDAEIDKLEVIECGKNSGCRLSEESRYVDNANNETLADDIIDRVKSHRVRNDHDLTNKGDIEVSSSTVYNDVTEGYNETALNSSNLKLSSTPFHDVTESSTPSNDDVSDINVSSTSSNSDVPEELDAENINANDIIESSTNNNDAVDINKSSNSNNDIPEELNDEAFNPDDVTESGTNDKDISDIKKSSTSANIDLPTELKGESLDSVNNITHIQLSSTSNNHILDITKSSTPSNIGIMETSTPENVDSKYALLTDGKNSLSNKDVEHFSSTPSNDDIPEELLLNDKTSNTANITMPSTSKIDNGIMESSTLTNVEAIMDASTLTDDNKIMESSTPLNIETLGDEPSFYDNGPIEVEIPDTIEEETSGTTKDDFYTLSDYADYTTEKDGSDRVRSSQHDFGGDASHTIESRDYTPSFIQPTTPISPVDFVRDRNAYEVSSVPPAKSETRINSVYLKHLNASTAGNITQELLKKKLDFENIFDEEEKLNKPDEEADVVKAKSRPSRRKGSLAFVFDATGSMWDDLVQLRKGADLILETMLDREDKPIQNYVLVPFRDPDVGPVGVSTDDAFLQNGLENLSVYGGGSCPEKSLTGIMAALEASLPYSFIYVFTDATADDYTMVDSVIDLVQKKHSQIVFVLTGDCKSRDKPGYTVYEDIAAASSGQVFRLEKNDVFDVTKFVRDTLDANRVNLGSSINPPGDHEHKLTVDHTLKKVTVSVSGNEPKITVMDPHGKAYIGPPKIIPILDLSDVKVVNIIDPEPGNWTLTVGSLQNHSVKVTGLSDLHFEHGFSVQPTDKFSETNNRPLSGAQNSMMIAIDEEIEIDTLTSAELLNVKGDTFFEVPLKKLEKKQNEPHLFSTEPFLPPSSLFNIAINGIDKDGNLLRRISSTGINPQLPEKPILNVPPEITGRIHSPLVLQCVVQSMVPITVWWFKNGAPVMERQDHVQSATAEYLITNLDEKSEGRYVCKASNSAGHSAAAVNVILTADPPRVEMVPNDTSALLGKVVTLECIVESMLPAAAQIFFQNKNKANDYSPKIDVGGLRQTFKGMATIYSHEVTLSEETQGLYTCSVTNKGGTTQSQSSITLLTPLKVEAFPKIMEYEGGGALGFSCIVHGSTDGKWVFLDNDVKTSGDLDWDVTRVPLATGGVQIFMDAKNPTKRHQGVYDCYAFRDQETVHDTVESRYVEAPSIVTPKESVSFELDSTAVLECVATGIPPPTISWFLPDGAAVMMESEETKRIYVQESRLVINNANPVDNGKYICSAENQFGVAKNELVLTVWKKPTLIDKLENKTINIYDSLTIPCKVTGVPLPLVAWYFEETKLANVETTSEGSLLLLSRVDVKDAGKYTCLAENQHGILKEEVFIRVDGLEAPIVTKGNRSIIIKEGENFEVKCRSLQGKPLPSLYWQKDGINITDRAPNDQEFMDEDKPEEANTDIEMILNNVMYEQEGNYSCVGTNIVGEDRYDFYLDVQRPPKFARLQAQNTLYEDYEDIQEGDGTVEAIAGTEILLNCEVAGKPKPFVTWSKDGIPVVFTNIVYTDESKNLIISDVKEVDGGTYTCFATNPVGTVNKNFTVNVIVKPRIVNDRTEPVLQTVEGQLVVLPCSVYAVPAAEISWLFNKEPIVPSDRMQLDSENTLRFVANLTDSGIYKCQAINKAGNSSQEYLVLVFVPPYIYPSGNEVVKAAEGSYIALDCHAIGFPEPNIIWSKNGQPINSSDIIINDSGRLNITKVNKNNSGTFICEAENYAGFSEKIFYVVLNEVPNILASELPVNIQLLAGEDEFNIPCRASGNPAPYISWMKDGKYIVNDLHTKVHADGTLSLRLVTEDLSGKYTCQAANTEGSIEIDYHVQVIAPPALLDADEHEKTIIAVEGSTANLECPLQPSLFMPNIQWYKNSDLIENNANTTTLKLLNVSRTDASEYSCLASNTGGKVSATFKLVVQWPPTFISGNSDESEYVHFLEGEPMKLSCHVDANPAADVQWLRNLEMIGDISPILRRNFVKTHHAGEHMCVASNPHGQTKKKFTVDVSAPPKIDGPETVNMEVRLGQAVRLDCINTGFPKPDIQWTVKYAPDWDIIGDGRMLKTFNVSQYSEGSYVCVAKNKAGNASKHFNLSILEQPRVPAVKVNVSGSQEVTDAVGNIALKVGSNVSIMCIADGNPPSSVMWIKNGVVLNNSESLNMTELSFENLHARDSGKYTCVSKNKIGTEELDIHIDVLALPEILDDTTNEIRLSNNNRTKNRWKTFETLERQSIKLVCRAQGNPVPDIYWFKDKNYLRFYDANVMTEDHGQVLLIKKVSREHAGNYTCVARNNIGEDKMNYQVDVWVSPYVEQQKDGGTSFVAKQGQNVHLECPITSNPKPVIRWLKHPYFDIGRDKFPHMQTRDSNSVLIINNVTVADNGNYSCIGTNKVGTTEMLFTMEVVETPRILDDPEKKGSEQTPGEMVAKIRRGFQLTCNAVAHPEPEIFWYKDGFRLHNSYGADSLHISKDGRFLNVMDAGLGNAGNYLCNAHNKVGEVEKEFHVKVLVPAEWGTWSQWSECNASCGSGVSIRRRECQFHGDLEALSGFSSRQVSDESNSDRPMNDGQETKVNSNENKNVNKTNKKLSEDLLDKSACRGNDTDRRECFILPCKVDGGWSSWGSWTSCSVVCGTGSRRRYRSCSNPRAQHGGAPCLGADAQQEPCQGLNCSRWLSWSAWGECSVTCGKGLQTRSRKCDGPSDSCLGLNKETRTCLLPSCPVKPVWGEWSEWSPCSATCGTGQRKRWRDCRGAGVGGAGCSGGNLQIEKCLDIHNSCNKYIEGINDIYGRNTNNKRNNKALLNISGKLNGFNLPSKFVEADILEKNGRKYVQTALNDILSKKDDYLPFMSFMISPTKLEESKEKNYLSNPLASNRLRMLPTSYEDEDDDSQIQFATGEQIHFHHRNKGVSESGEMLVDIIIDGDIPDYNNNEKSGIPAMLVADGRDGRRPPANVLTVNTCSEGYEYNVKTKQCQDTNECESTSNGCHSTQMCENLPGSYRCLCQHGYMSIGIGQRCLDVNECLQNTDGCSHECVNTAGSYYCACPRGFKLTGDSKTCVQEDLQKWLQGFEEPVEPPPIISHLSNPGSLKLKSEVKEGIIPSSDEDHQENILLTRISPTRDKSKPYQRKSRPHKYHVDDYDYGILSPFREDEYTDYNDGKGRQRISKQSKWSQPLISATDDEKDTYDTQEKKKNATEHVKNKIIKSKLDSFFDLKNQSSGKRQKMAVINEKDILESTTQSFKNDAKGINTENNKKKVEKIYGQENSYEDVDESYEDEDSYAKLFGDSCPEGYHFDNNKCNDIDECAMNMNLCNGVISMCINTRGSYLCVPTSCPDTYQRTANGSCEQKCDVRDAVCSEGAALRQSMIFIIFPTSVYETPVPGPILYLNYGGRLNYTTYKVERQPQGETFYVETDDKMGILNTLMKPSLKRINRIIVSSRGYDEKGTKLLYFTKFIIYLYIWE